MQTVMFMPKNLLVFLLFFSTFTLAVTSEVSVDVEIPINGMPDSQVQNIAKNKAVVLAMEQLPKIVWGTETSINGNYSENIKAISFAQAQVEVTNELFDRVNQQYTLKANVSWDQSQVMTMLDEVQKGEKAKVTLNQIKSLIGTASFEDYVNYKGNDRISPLTEAKLLVNPLFYSGTYKELQNNHLSMLTQMRHLSTRKLLDDARSIEIKLIDADSASLSFEISKPETTQHLSFKSQVIEDFYLKNIKYISEMTGSLCLFSPTSLAAYKLPELQATSLFKVQIVISSSFISEVHSELLYQGKMRGFDVVICDTQTLMAAREIRSYFGMALVKM
jgi:hypothetical protein